MKYSQKTHELIERMCRNVERNDFTLNKKKAEEFILKTYDLFDLERPKNIIWHTDIFDKYFQEAASSARSVSSTRSAWLASSARLAWSASSASSAWSARLARSVSSTRSASSAWLALDYDFDCFVFEHEYCENPSDKKPNENDYRYLEYSELLMQAKEAGLGYKLEYEGTLYLVPTPLVKIDENNQFHSPTQAAIRWKGGEEFYFLHGVNFDKETWGKIANRTIPAKDVLSLKNTEQTMAAMKVLGIDYVFKALNAEDCGLSKAGTERLWLVKDVFGEDTYFLEKHDYSSDKTYYECVGNLIGYEKIADEALRWQCQLPQDKYQSMVLSGVRA